MSNIGSSLSDCCSYLESPKKTERRKRIEELKLLLENSHTIDYLNKNSEALKELSWNKVFSSLHKCVLKESECISDEKQRKSILPSTDKAVKGCCGLLISVVSAANTGYPRLSCQELFSCILEVCEAANSNEIIRNSVIFETYVNLLGLSLSSEKYWGELSFKTWKDLGKFALGILRRLPSEKMKATIISILNIVLLQGGRLSPLIGSSRPLLGAFPELLQAMVKSKYPVIELSCLYITHTFCTQFAKEFRLAVCNFIDKILPHILSLNENRISDARFKDLIAEVLIEMMSIRMSEKEWHQMALSVLAFADNELNNISKHKITMANEIPKIVILAVKLVKQIHTLSIVNEDCDISASKRRKISTNIGSVLDNLRLHWNNPWPWLCYLDQLLEKAPEVVLDEDIHPLCQYFSNNLSQSNDPVSLRFLTKAAVRLLNFCKKKFKDLDKCSQDLLNILWSSVLRTVTNSALSDIELNLANDLVPDLLLPECAKSLLEFFIENKIPVTKTSLTTVFNLSSAGLIGSPSERNSLILWCLSGEHYSPETVFCLLLRTKCLSPPKRFHCSLNLTDAESFYIVTSFGILPTSPEESPEFFNLEFSSTALIEDKPACQTYLTQVIQKLSNVNSLENLLQLSIFLCTLQSYLVKHNISIRKKHDEILEKILPEIVLQLENKLKSSNRDHPELVLMVTSLFTNLWMLNKSIDRTQCLFNLLMELLKQHHKAMEEQNEVPSVKIILEVEFSESSRDNFEITIINAMFAIINTFSENDKIPAYVNLINFCLTEMTLTIQSGLDIASSIIKKIVTTQSATQVLMKDILSLELRLSQKWFRHYSGTLQVLDIIEASVKTLFKCDHKGELKSQLYRILSLYCKGIDDKKFGSGIITKFISLLITVIQADPCSQYMINGRQTILLYLIDFLNSRYHEVRVKTAGYLPVLFGNKISCLSKRSDLNEAFNRAIKATDNMFLVKEGKSPDDIKEEGLNRSCGALKILLGLTCSCYIWRKPALFHLFRIISSKNISQSLFGKVHHYLEQSLGIENLISFLEQNLDYILWCWYKEYKTFERFPYNFMNYDCLSTFLKEYKTIVLPIYLENIDSDGFSSLCDSLSVNKTEIAVSCFPEIIACLLPKVGGSQMEAAEKINSFILQLIDQRTIKSLLVKELKKVLLAVFMKLNDIDHFTDLCGPTNLQLPISCPLNVHIDAVNASLGQMQRTIPNPQQSLLVYLSNEYPGHIQFLLQNLLAHISIATTTEIRSLCFFQYITVCDSIVSELSEVKKMAGYIILHAIHALLYLMRTDIALPATSYLYRFLEKCLPARAKYVNYALDDLFPAVASLSLDDSDIGLAATQVKELLLSQKDMLPRVVAYLPLEETCVSLEEELKTFLRRQNPDFVALDRLSSQLSFRKQELYSLYDEVKNSRCFSDDCSKSLVHNFISKLVTLTTSADSEIRASAARCLGQIGPRNLHTLALKPENSSAPPPMADKILNLLLPLLVHSDAELCEAASAAACELLSTSEGFASFEQLKGVEKALLIPFCPLSSELKQKIPTNFSPEKLAWASCSSVMGNTSHKGWAFWSDGDHSSWIRNAVSQLLLAFNEGLLPLLSPICSIQVDVSEELLPYVVDVIIDLSEKIPDGLRFVQTNLAYFFKKHFELRNTSGAVEGSSIYLNRKSVQCMISIVNFCRLKTSVMLEDERLNNLKKLNVSFLHVAYAAQFCKAYFTSLLYVELWVESLRSELNQYSVDLNKVPLDIVCQKYPDDGKILLNILWEDYKELGEQDNIEGCARLQLGDPNRRLHYFREMGLWSHLIAEADIGNQKEALTQGLLMSGLLTCASELNNCNWDAAWRLTRWDIEQPVPGSEDFSSLHYSAIRSALHLKDKQNALSFVESARSLVLNDLADASLEVAVTVYQPLAKLQLITELEGWCNGEDISSETMNTTEWTHAEPILWQRGLLVADPEIWLRTAKIARNNSSHLVALKSIQHMKGMNVSLDLKDEAKAEEAQIHWDYGNFEAAKFLLKNLLNTVGNSFLKAKCLITYGTWMSESKSEGPKVISQYFAEAASLLESKPELRLAAAECLAKFADLEYKRISRYFRSPEFELKKSHLDTCRKRLEVYKTYPPQTLEEKKSSKIYEFNVEVDEAEMNALQTEHASFLCLAIREYLYCLQFDETTDDRMFRFVSLWLSNNKLPELQKEVDQHLSNIPSYRFIPVFPQLVVRISPELDHFTRSLQKLIFRCCEDHPYHCLWHVLALANADIDQPKSESSQQPVPRVIGAMRLLQDLLKSKSVDRIVQGMQKLAKAYISLANLQVNQNQNQRQFVGDFKIPQNERLKQIKDVPYITCATLKNPINKKADYSNIIGIVRFDEVCSVLCGLNAPKRIKCLCTDGRKRDELVKGQDDLRQDALMQQVFSVLNILLEGDKNTSSRKLNVRTYKVVPLTQKSGVIEWCCNTEPLGLYLPKAHARHRPQDFTQAKCRNLLSDVATKSHEEKLKTFLTICSKYKPVMRHFFFEKFPTSGVWYEKRLAYIKSVATNSMIGFIMGIGDRHVMNILIDQETAELIHIDFGIAFELGKILPTPETVPFRLTRDIEDGMGITGVEGVFRRCCEETMKVLRKRSEPIITVLEMLIYDPLHTWSIKPRRSDRSQQPVPNISAEETNKLAERFLQRLKLKLEGRDEGCEALSVERQVENLIQEAKDPRNLCRLYRGWQAYL